MHFLYLIIGAFIYNYTSSFYGIFNKKLFLKDKLKFLLSYQFKFISSQVKSTSTTTLKIT